MFTQSALDSSDEECTALMNQVFPDHDPNEAEYYLIDDSAASSALT